MKAGAKMVVQGTVQGIFFRQFVKGHAEDLKLRGFVRNLSNGDVEVIVEGEKESIARLLEFVKKGPEHSQIRHVEVTEKKWSGDFKEFKILRF
jgi:acylphosphatase|tara:strand:- start:758 stop:1036 length:279 start_codon:yes stop_codon:yes gene_type:complete